MERTIFTIIQIGKRGDLTLFAESHLVLRPGDILILKSDKLAKPRHLKRPPPVAV